MHGFACENYVCDMLAPTSIHSISDNMLVIRVSRDGCSEQNKYFAYEVHPKQLEYKQQ